MQAIEDGEHARLDALLHFGADPDRAGPDGKPPIFFAAQLGDARSVRALCMGGAELNLMFGPIQASALCIAAHKGHTDATAELLAAGVLCHSRF